MSGVYGFLDDAGRFVSYAEALVAMRAERDAAVTERDAAIAELERLRPAAEAFDEAMTEGLSTAITEMARCGCSRRESRSGITTTLWRLAALAARRAWSTTEQDDGPELSQEMSDILHAPARVASLTAENERLRNALRPLASTVTFLGSVIRSGESFTPDVQQAVQNAYDRIAAALAPVEETP